MEAHEIIGQVHDAFPKLPSKVARLKGVSDELIRSHHREPKSRNPLASGNTSATTHFIQQCHEYEAAERSAGRMLANRVHASLTAEFDDGDHLDQEDITDNVLDEGCDVNKWLSRFKMETATERQLHYFETQCDEAIDAILRAKAKARSFRRLNKLEAVV